MPVLSHPPQDWQGLKLSSFSITLRVSAPADAAPSSAASRRRSVLPPLLGLPLMPITIILLDRYRVNRALLGDLFYVAAGALVGYDVRQAVVPDLKYVRTIGSAETATGAGRLIYLYLCQKISPPRSSLRV
jgi:hypothetical protein